MYAHFFKQTVGQIEFDGPLKKITSSLRSGAAAAADDVIIIII